MIPINPFINRPIPSSRIKIEMPVAGNTMTAKAITTDSKPSTSHKARLHKGSVVLPYPSMMPENPITKSETANKRIIISRR